VFILIEINKIEYWSHRVEDPRVIPYNQTNKKAIEHEEKDAESLTSYHTHSLNVNKLPNTECKFCNAQTIEGGIKG